MRKKHLFRIRRKSDSEIIIDLVARIAILEMRINKLKEKQNLEVKLEG